MQRGQQREAEQRNRAEQEPKHEYPESTAPPGLLGRHGDGRRNRWHRHQRMLALDQPARDIIGDGIDECGELVELEEAAQGKVCGSIRYSGWGRRRF